MQRAVEFGGLIRKGHVCYVNSEGNRFQRPLFNVKQFEDMGFKMTTNPTALLCPVTQEFRIGNVVRLDLAARHAVHGDQRFESRNRCRTEDGRARKTRSDWCRCRTVLAASVHRLHAR